MWMPALTTGPPLALARRAAGISAPTGAKTIAPSSCSGGARRSDAGPHRAQLARERLRRGVALAGEGEDAPALVRARPGEDVGGGAEAVEADPLGLAGQAQRPIADQPGAEQRRRLLVGIAGRQREAEALVGDRQLGVAAVDVVAGEAGAVAEVLAARAAVAALAAGPAQPGHADPVAAAAKRSRPRPTSTTVPTIWWPGTSGSFGSSSSPSTMCRSVRQTPQAPTEIRTWPAPGRGSGSSAGRSGSPARSRTIARIATQGETGTGNSAGSTTSSPDPNTSSPARGSSASSSAIFRGLRDLNRDAIPFRFKRVEARARASSSRLRA